MTDARARFDQRETERLPFDREEVERSLPERFARVAATRPSAVAIASGSERVTYGELASRSDALAAAIGRQASGSEAPVAVLLSDPISMITGILAAWKAGRLCVPLAHTLPPARLEVILRDSEAGLIVTDRKGSAALPPLPGTSARQLLLDTVDLLAAVEPPRVTVTPDTLACLLYTSGSTGKPKGVLKTHRNLLHRARCFITSVAIRPEDRVSALHSPAFAAGLRDVLTALLSGATLLPFDLRRAGLRALAGWIDQEEISVLCAVVTTIRHLFASLGPEARFPSVRVVRLGSEPFYRQDVERLRRHLRPDCVLISGYGASEASGIAAYRVDQDTPLPAGRVPAGYALDGVEIVLLDDDGHPVGTGQAGEVVVRSRYLSPGYWRQPDLTRAMFLPDPADAQMRAYHTGDIGRLRSDGCLEVLGRRDHQVKVRGYLVHPGEIEMALVEHPAIREAVVTAWADADGETRLAAYVVPHALPAPYAGVLRRYLQARLPAYMVPSAFVSLETLPLNANGKVDRRTLPPPPRPAVAREVDFVPPRSPMEHQIAAIWEELFGVSPIGANDNFFDLGGDSLLAAAFVVAIEDTCGRVLSPSLLLEASTVADLAATMIRVEGGFNERVTALRASGKRSPLFFLHNDYGRGVYTYALARCLDPNRPFYAVHLHGLDEPALPATVEAIAANRLQAVRDARRHGPYVLGGHCNGGLIALEMARQLRAQGERVEAVVMIDTRAPALGRRALHRASDVLGRLRGLPPDARAGLFVRVDRAWEEIDEWARYYQNRLGILRRSGTRAQMDFLGRKLVGTARRLARVLESRPERRDGAPAHAPPVLTEPRQTYRRAIRRYAPSRYAGLVALFRAEQFPAHRPDLGWARLLPRLEVGVIPGDHHSCITRHVAAFGARLEEVLHRADDAP
jgi:amino acid adenylation domain-containing protein